MRCLVLLMLLALALPVTAASQDSRADHHKGKTTSAAQPIKQQNAQTPVVPLAVLESVQTTLDKAITTIKQQAETADKQAETYKETWRSPSVLVNIALAILGFFYLIFMRLQWKSMENSLRITQHAALGISHFDAHISDSNGKWIVAFVVNYGKISATKIRISLHAIGSTDNPKTIDYDQLVQPDISRMTSGEMMPNVPHPVPIDLDGLTADQINQISAGELFLYVVGFIKYDDGFGKEVDLPVRYSYGLGPPGILYSAIERP
jgi:hypothetical protein